MEWQSICSWLYTLQWRSGNNYSDNKEKHFSAVKGRELPAYISQTSFKSCPMHGHLQHLVVQHLLEDVAGSTVIRQTMQQERGLALAWLVQGGWSWLRFPMRSFHFRAELILPAALWTCDRLSLTSGGSLVSSLRFRKNVKKLSP
jgi:hypothetical protein